MADPRDVTELSDSLRLITRTMHSLRTQQLLQTRSGTEIDKLGEVILLQAMGELSCRLRLSDIAQKVGVELSTVSRKVQRLEAAGLIERVSDPEDGRASRLKLTEAGEETVAALAMARAQLAENALASWSPKDRDTLTRLLSRFAEDLQTEVRDIE